MPGMDGLELKDELRRRRAMIPIIFITGDADVEMAVEAMHMAPSTSSRSRSATANC